MNLSRLKYAVTIALCSLLGACASTQNQSNIRIEQKAALQRWDNCVDLQTEFGSASEALLRVNLYCEGHKRDLIATYPAHLENEVSKVLTQRTQKLAAEQLARRVPEAKQGAFSVTLK
ncbi:MAG: hypothetical protein V3U65_12255 [Granulosicoccaceae bacterium]